MLPTPPESPEDLIPYIEAAGESPNVDAKGPMAWDGAEASASLAKDVMAFANSRDGGVIVIGKSENPKGTFVLEGVTKEQASSFETTNVATWVNNHCQPSVHVTSYPVEHDGKLFVVLRVREFDDVPVICTKDFQSNIGNKWLLRRGYFYVRTANSESAPLQTVEQVRHLIGLATLKRGDQMLSLFQSMLKGQPLLQPAPTTNPYKEEIADLESLVNNELDKSHEKGDWTFIIYPEEYQSERWPNDQLPILLESCSVKVRGRPFPGRRRNTQYQNQGIIGNYYKDSAFCWNRSGLFLGRYGFIENSRVFKDPWQPAIGSGKPNLPEGTWLDFQFNLFLLIESFWFASRVAHELKQGNIVYEVRATGLRGRRLVSMNADIDVYPSDPCKSPEFSRRKVIAVEGLMVGWEDECVSILTDFFRVFAGDDIGREILAHWIEKFKGGK